MSHNLRTNSGPALVRLPLLSLVRLLLCSALIGCASQPSSKIEHPAGPRVEYAQIDEAPPIVVFENGLGAGMTSWEKVFTRVGQEATVFAYNRPGYGRSDPASTPRDGAQIVAELRTLLRERALHPPYLLVGHSLGGLYVQLFARQYPEEVQGLILVDSSHPTQFEGVGSIDNWPLWARTLRLFLSGSQKQELALSKVTGQQVLRLPTYSSGPVVVLSAIEKSHSEIAQFMRAKRADLPRLYPGSRQVWVVDSGHFIQQERPDVVIEAIQGLLQR